MPTRWLVPSSQADDAWKEELLAYWRRQQRWVLEKQVTIAETPAPTGHESARAALVQREWTAAGLQATRIDAAGNVIARVTANPTIAIAHDHSPARAPLVCLAHLDTVFPAEAPLRAQRVGSQVHCPGIGDNSRGLAATIALAHALQSPAIRTRLTRTVELVATVGEEGEGNLRGARAYFDELQAHGLDAYAAIAIDGPGDSTIVHHAVGSERVRIHFTGHSGHSWVNAGTPNPVHAAGALIAMLARLAEHERPHAAITVSRMGGGESLTSIPRAAWIDVDIRAMDAARVTRLHASILQLAQRAADDESRARPALGLLVHTEPLGSRPAGHLDAEHPLVQTAARITERVGRAPRSGSASTDANVPLSRGIPAIAIGAGGSGGDAHTLSEWFDDNESDVGLTRLIDLVVSVACAP